MNRWLLMVLLGVGMVRDVPAGDQPTRASPPGICQVADNHIIGPRTRNRPLPLVAGDAAHGFHPACAVSWSALSPNNQSLPVVGCFQNNLLQLDNDAACGQGTGRLWVSSRWVLTSAELQRAQERVAASCQRLDNSAVAATRDWLPDCVPHDARGAAAATPPAVPTAAPAAPAAPAGAPATSATPH